MGKVPVSAGQLFLQSIAEAAGVAEARAPQTSLTSFVNTEPASASLTPGQFKFWLDATPGATKLMIKAKDSNGAVRTGQVVLS